MIITDKISSRGTVIRVDNLYTEQHNDKWAHQNCFDQFESTRTYDTGTNLIIPSSGMFLTTAYVI